MAWCSQANGMGLCHFALGQWGPKSSKIHKHPMDSWLMGRAGTCLFKGARPPHPFSIRTRSRALDSMRREQKTAGNQHQWTSDSTKLSADWTWPSPSSAPSSCQQMGCTSSNTKHFPHPKSVLRLNQIDGHPARSHIEAFCSLGGTDYTSQSLTMMMIY